MSRDHRKLDVFKLADDLIPRIYAATRRFPPEERFALQAQLRRAALSIAANIVEGSARRTTKEYVDFLNISAGSAAETWYLIDVAARLGFMEQKDRDALFAAYQKLAAQLLARVRALADQLESDAKSLRPAGDMGDRLVQGHR